MGTVYQPLMQEMPAKPDVSYRWIDILWLAVALFLVFWTVHQQNDWALLAFLPSFVVPDNLCRKFQDTQKPQKSGQDLIGRSKPLQITCWIVAIVTFTIAILGGLGVHPMCDILVLAAWLVQFLFDWIPLWLFALLGIVFLPVFRVATFIEKRVWLQWVWASAAIVQSHSRFFICNTDGRMNG